MYSRPGFDSSFETPAADGDVLREAGGEILPVETVGADPAAATGGDGDDSGDGPVSDRTGGERDD